MSAAEERQIPQQRHRRDRGVGAEEMQKRYPSLRTLTGPTGRASERAWVATFNARPEAMQAILADYIKQVHAKPGRIGQRPMPREREVDFNALVYGETTDEPLTKVLPALVRALPPHLSSERGFCAAIMMSKTQYRRVVDGQYEPDVDQLRRIATAVRKSPVFFVEYRKAMVVAAVVNLLDERPGVATALYRKYLDAQL